MSSDSEPVEVLERARALRTLLCLHEASDETPASTLLENIGGSRTTGISRLDEFRDVGLVEKRAGDNRTLYRLTEDGERVAEHLVKATTCIEELLEENDE